MIFISTKKDKIRISVIGGNGNGVTGSCTYINFLDYHMLFEFGMIQDKHTVLDLSLIHISVDKNISTEWYVTATEALEYGICHKIIDDLDMLFE